MVSCAEMPLPQSYEGTFLMGAFPGGRAMIEKA
jgi:hypothetical protein